MRRSIAIILAIAGAVTWAAPASADRPYNEHLHIGGGFEETVPGDGGIDLESDGDILMDGTIGIGGTPPVVTVKIYIPTGSVTIGQNETYATDLYFDSGWKFAEDGGFYGGYLLHKGTGGGQLTTTTNSGNAGVSANTINIISWTAPGVVTIANDLFVLGGDFVVGSGDNGKLGSTTNGNQIELVDATNTTIETHLQLGLGAAGIDYVLTFDGDDNDGTITYMEDEDRFDFDNLISTGNAIHFAEGSAPTAIGSSGAWWTTSSNQIFFQDGGGTSHLMGPPAFGGIAFTVVPADEVALTISNRDEWTKITVFDSADGHVNTQDVGGNVTGNKANSELTIGTDGGGSYRLMLSSSLSSVSASKMFFLGTAVDPASPITITSHTSATPSVITTASAHDLIVGDSIIITGSTDGTINRSSMVKTASGSTLTLDGFDGDPLGGTAGTGGTIDTLVHSSTIAHRVTNSTVTGSFNAPGDIDVLAGDVVYAVILNRTDSVNPEFETINLQITRVGT